ncbi:MULTISPECIES: hypothetical protein [unclassified Curtobacterium]|uniref:hypothetical protein n=1 Tax=unclassified Curtobacterium TaxID=257496 RepID=UPI00226B144A|nr:MULTISPECIES: hypothetical protein [unclassified Curtobacterium]
MNAAEVVALLTPMFREMLDDVELASLRFGIVPMDDPDGPHRLRDDDPVRSNAAVVRWQILGERGWSRGLDGDEDTATLVRGVQSDLQDFISESDFGWGQLRGPRDLT